MLLSEQSLSERAVSACVAFRTFALSTLIVALALLATATAVVDDIRSLRHVNFRNNFTLGVSIECEVKLYIRLE